MWLSWEKYLTVSTCHLDPTWVSLGSKDNLGTPHNRHKGWGPRALTTGQVLLQGTSLQQEGTSLYTGLPTLPLQVLRHLQPVDISLVALLAIHLEPLAGISLAQAGDTSLVQLVPLGTNLVQLGTNRAQLVTSLEQLDTNLAQLGTSLAQLGINLAQLGTSQVLLVVTSLVPPEALQVTNHRVQQLATTNPSIQLLGCNSRQQPNRPYHNQQRTISNSRSPTALSKIHTGVKPPQAPLKDTSKSREAPSKATSQIDPTEGTNNNSNNSRIATRKIHHTRAKSHHLVGAMVITTRGPTRLVPPGPTRIPGTGSQSPRETAAIVPGGIQQGRRAAGATPPPRARRGRRPGTRITNHHRRRPVVTPPPPPPPGGTRIRATTRGHVTTSARLPAEAEVTVTEGTTATAGQIITLAAAGGATTTRSTAPG